ncbi:Outer membrane protein Imp, required for envelope biogenesis / Organic solvent tolerance protein precursor [hydrothermal vent metagenome]|uniref:Outer membrane protein Imp, required for envelope biogenesis / Organic solvent tolerance protein n=1 Tax=hydrothermal vent metagenome TaxID=652676 RepID=A0A1W1CCQ0_9ZZZZ
MRKYFLFLFLLLSTSLYAGNKIEIYASKLTSHNDIIDATGGVSVIYKDYILTANRAHYDKKTGELELFDNIRANSAGKYKVLGKYAKLNLAKKEKVFRPFYMIDNRSDVWMSGAEGKANNAEIDIGSGVVSGCNPIDPLWTMEFSASDYNTESKWINLYNMRLYIYDIPVLYTPYFGYSLDTTRRSGLLKPSIGLSNDEGFYYRQPIYIAEQNWWDLELLPQIRTNRGSGLYANFRFLDSKVSHGEITMGYFKEKQTYFEKNNLQNDSHYGLNIKYDNRDFLNLWSGYDFSGQSGLYVDINHMNDVDYINLASNNTENQTTSKQVLSRINMFYNTTKQYIGTYFKYYQDLALENNDNTLQKLPTLQYHYYLDTLLKDHLLYSLNVKSNNIQRKINKKIIQTDINLPITLQTSLFDDFLNISYTANLYMQHSTFRGNDINTTTTYRDGYYARNYHTFKASTQLTKAYENVSHVIGLSIIYNKSSWNQETGFYADEDEYCSDINNQTTPECEFYNITDIDNAAQLQFTQYLYDNKAQQIFYHRLAQRVSYSSKTSRYGELENELDYKLTSWLSFYNNMFYNYDHNAFSKIFNKLSLHNNYGMNLQLSYLYKDNFMDATSDSLQYTKYLTSDIEYDYNRHYSLSALYNYDMESKEKKSMSIGFMYKKRCWDFGIKYSENNRPILTTNGGASSIYDKYIYVTIVLKPLMQPSKNSSFITYKLPNKQIN